MKPCPFCAEEIQDAAIKCRHCGADLVPTKVRELAHRWAGLSEKGRSNRWAQLSEEEQGQLRAYLAAQDAGATPGAAAYAAAYAPGSSGCGKAVLWLALGFVALVVLFVVVVNIQQATDKARKAKAERRAEAERIELQESQKDENFQAATAAIADGRHAEAVELLKKVREVEPGYPGLAEALVVAEAEAERVAEEERQAEIKRLVARARTVTDAEGLAAIYKRLASLEPENADYRKKYEEYDNQAIAQRVNERLKKEAPLRLLSWRWGEEYSYAIAEGQVRNVSAASLKNVTAVVTWYTASGEMITSDSALIEYNPIMPGQCLHRSKVTPGSDPK